MSNGKTTIYDIANHLKLSTATVSRAINNDIMVSEETLQRVRKAAQLLGYVPKPVKSRQGCRSERRRKKKNHRILFLNFLAQDIMPGLLGIVEEKLREANYSLEFGNVMFTRQRIAKADGVILGTSINDPSLRRLLRSKVTVQVLGHSMGDGKLLWDHITYNNNRVGQIAADYLMGKQHKSVVVFYPNNQVARMRTLPFCEKCITNGLEVKTFEHPGFEFDVKLLEKQIFELRQLCNPPTGFFAFNATMAVSLHSSLLKAGFIPGDDVEIIACDNDKDILNVLNPKPATIEIHPEQIATRAIQQLLWRFEHLHEQPATIIIEPKLIKP